MTSDVRGLSRGDEAAGRDERLEISVSRERDREAAGLSLRSHHVRGLSGNLLLCWQGGGIQQTEGFILLWRGEALSTRDLSVMLTIAGGHREAEHEGGGGGEVGPGGGSLPPPGGSDVGHPRQSPCSVSSLVFHNISVGQVLAFLEWKHSETGGRWDWNLTSCLCSALLWVLILEKRHDLVLCCGGRIVRQESDKFQRF